MVMTSLDVCGYVTTFHPRMLKLQETDAGASGAPEKSLKLQLDRQTRAGPLMLIYRHQDPLDKLKSSPSAAFSIISGEP
jgi:hypothetical protein